MSWKKDATEGAEIRLLADGSARGEEPSGMVYDFKELLSGIVPCLGKETRKRRLRSGFSPMDGLAAKNLPAWSMILRSSCPI